jgi:hypothetical protein
MKLIVETRRRPHPGRRGHAQWPDGKKLYTEETDEGLHRDPCRWGRSGDRVPSLGRKDFAANVTVTDEQPEHRRRCASAVRSRAWPVGLRARRRRVRQRWRPYVPSPSRLDSVVEFMTYKKSARIEISHTDNVVEHQQDAAPEA